MAPDQPLTGETRDRGSSLLRALAYCLVLILIAENIYLSVQNHRLKSHDDLRPPAMAEGAILANLVGAGPGGVYTRISLPGYPGNRMLLATLSPDCGACTAEAPLLRTAMDDAAAAGWRVAIVARGDPQSTATYLDAAGLHPAVWVSEVPHGVYNELSLAAVPQLAAVGDGGVILRSWPGKLDEARLQEVLQFVSKSKVAKHPAERSPGINRGD